MKKRNPPISTLLFFFLSSFLLFFLFSLLGATDSKRLGRLRKLDDEIEDKVLDALGLLCRQRAPLRLNQIVQDLQGHHLGKVVLRLLSRANQKKREKEKR